MVTITKKGFRLPGDIYDRDHFYKTPDSEHFLVMQNKQATVIPPEDIAKLFLYFDFQKTIFIRITFYDIIDK